jgi:hypothetical protein
MDLADDWTLVRTTTTFGRREVPEASRSFPENIAPPPPPAVRVVLRMLLHAAKVKSGRLRVASPTTVTTVALAGSVTPGK